MSSVEEGRNFQISRDMDVNGHCFVFRQMTDRTVKLLEYDYKRCVGCGICVGICPTKALELGPIKEIATGLDAPPVMMDLDKCTFCSMCASFCPLDAFRMSSQGDIAEKMPELETYVRMNEKCLPCAICAAACPKEAIDLVFTFQKKEEIAPFLAKEERGFEGEIAIDTEKCNLCGICAEFCDAFLLVGKEMKPDSPNPFELLLVDEDKCDYCVLCQDICPEEAILVKGERRGEAPVPEGHLRVDEQKCTRCTWCQVLCPYEAVDIKKPFAGEIKLKSANISACDPQGCHACFNICPSKLWYVPQDSDAKIAIMESYCTYCGACVNACPKDVMEVLRTDVSHTVIPDAPWAYQWKDAVNAIKTGKRQYPDTSRTLAIDNEVPAGYVEVTMPDIDPSYLEAAKKRLEDVGKQLMRPKYRKDVEARSAGPQTKE